MSQTSRDIRRLTWRVSNEQSDARSVALLESHLPGCEVKRLIDTNDPDLPESLRALRHAFVPDPELAAQIQRELGLLQGIEQVELDGPPELAAPPGWAEVQAAWTDGATSPDLRRFQRYLAPAPLGVGAREVTAVPGITGAGVLVVDVEDGWCLDHQELRGRDITVRGVNRENDHGTAVLGVLAANGPALTGLVPAAKFEVASGDADGDRWWNPENAIWMGVHLSRITRMPCVIVVEMQTPGPWPDGEHHGLLPVEYSGTTFEVIRAATQFGVHVVAAAGNGSVSLDDPRLQRRFDRESRDSGAILVGAGEPGSRKRVTVSNHGRRVDLQAWGEAVVTCGGLAPGYRDLVPPGPTTRDRCYTCNFRGTSAATAIVAGCVAAILGACRSAGVHAPTPRAMRELLRRTGTPQMGSDAQM
ncbi:MAG TPA: S8 family serine peptidase, partial [Enhygromyxa sp.]|nr:S8 family serine peptidase [Enhygromyxa sp.]